MGLEEQLIEEVGSIFRSQWEIREGRGVPDPDKVGLQNDGVKLDATVLYADIDGSTTMVDTLSREKAAEIYKAYLLAAVRIIRMEGGAVTAYDGDRVMAVFVGDSKNTTAVRCGMRIKYAVDEIVNPQFKKIYSSSDFVLKQVVGIDTSDLLVAQTGIRGNKDLVWVGRAANWAAKLSGISEQPYYLFVTDSVYKEMNSAVKNLNRVSVWEQRQWKGKTIYRTTKRWAGLD